MTADEQRSLLLSYPSSGRVLDREDITIDFPLCSKGLLCRRPSVLRKLRGQVSCGFSQRQRIVGMTFTDQRLKMADDAGPSVRQGWQLQEAGLRGDLCPDALARKHLEKNRMRHAAVDDVGLADALFERVQTGMYFG